MANYARATRSNRVFAHQLRWGDRFPQIAHLLGFRNSSPGEQQFVDAVVAWQRSNGLTDDGMLGPRTWSAMEPLTRFSLNAEPISPSWLRQPIVIGGVGPNMSESPNDAESRGGTGPNVPQHSPLRFTPMSMGPVRITDREIQRRREETQQANELVSAGRALGRLHATLLYLCHRHFTTDSVENLRAERESYQADPFVVSDDARTAVLSRIDAQIEFAQARDDGLVVGSGNNWTSQLPRLPEILGLGPSVEFVRAWDEGYDAQYHELHFEPLENLIAMIVTEILMWGAGVAVHAVSAGPARATVRGGARLTLRNAWRSIISRIRAWRRKPYINMNPRATPDEISLGTWLDEMAQAGQLGNVGRVRGMPEGGGASPDYHFLDRGMDPSDLAAPSRRADAVIAESANVDNVISNAIGSKAGRQAENVIVEIGRGNSARITDAAVTAWRVEHVAPMSPTLQRLIVVRNNGGVRTIVLDLRIR